MANRERFDLIRSRANSLLAYTGTIHASRAEMNATHEVDVPFTDLDDYLHVDISQKKLLRLIRRSAFGFPGYKGCTGRQGRAAHHASSKMAVVRTQTA